MLTGDSSLTDIVWTESALSDLDAVADYIALENPLAAAELVRKVFAHIKQLQDHPESGSQPVELPDSRYRQIIEPPCRTFYRYDGTRVLVLHVLRAEQLLRRKHLSKRDKK